MRTLSTYNNINVKDIKKAMKSNKYGRYILLYLYDGDIEESLNQTQELFRFYGREINNELGSDFTLFTVYAKDEFESWGDFVGKEVLKTQFVDKKEGPHSIDKPFDLMINLAEYYRVSLPALLVIDANSGVNASELVAKNEFTVKTPVDDISKRIISAIKAIKNYYGDFNRIAYACNTDITVENTTLIKKLTGNMNLYNVLSDYIERSSYNEKTLSVVLGISDRQLRRYKTEDCPLEYERAIAMAFLLKLSPGELDILFATANVKPILENKVRYDIIRKCLQSQKDLTTTNQILVQKGCRPIEVKGVNKKRTT